MTVENFDFPEGLRQYLLSTSDFIRTFYVIIPESVDELKVTGRIGELINALGVERCYFHVYQCPASR